MARNAVDDRSEVTCSQGLHFCSQEYLKSFSGDQIVVLKINPADVVSIPVDYNNTKGRCAAYQVIDVLSQEDFNKAMNTHILSESVYREVDDDFVDDDWVDDDWVEVDDDWVEVDDEGDEPVSLVTARPNRDRDRVMDGYDDGYRNGRAFGRDCPPPNGADSDYITGFLEGRADGAGHKKRRFSYNN
jgi:hypothetical protein